jgi:hypothetical protein
LPAGSEVTITDSDYFSGDIFVECSSISKNIVLQENVYIYLGWTCFLRLPNMYELLPRKWHWNMIPASSYDSLNCVQTHRDVLSSQGKKLFATPS